MTWYNLSVDWLGAQEKVKLHKAQSQVSMCAIVAGANCIGRDVRKTNQRKYHNYIHVVSLNSRYIHKV